MHSANFYSTSDDEGRPTRQKRRQHPNACPALDEGGQHTWEHLTHVIETDDPFIIEELIESTCKWCRIVEVTSEIQDYTLGRELELRGVNAELIELELDVDEDDLLFDELIGNLWE